MTRRAPLTRQEEGDAPEGWRDEIARLVDEARRTGSPEAQTALVRARHLASRRLAGAPTPWPRPVADHFPGETDVVELPYEEITPELVASAVQHHGCLLVRGLLDPDQCDRLVEEIDTAFEAQDVWIDHVLANPYAPRPDLAPWFVPFTPEPDMDVENLEVSRATRDFARVMAVDSPPAMFDVLDAYERAGLRTFMADYFGAPPMLSINKFSLRRLEPKLSIGWHQETHVFKREPVRTLNVWVAVCDIDEATPGLQVVPCRVGYVPAGDGPAVYQLPQAAFETAIGDTTPARPHFAPGDALFFDEYLLHRTQVGADMTKARYSIESWFFSCVDYPASVGPIAF